MGTTRPCFNTNGTNHWVLGAPPASRKDGNYFILHEKPGIIKIPQHIHIICEAKAVRCDFPNYFSKPVKTQPNQWAKHCSLCPSSNQCPITSAIFIQNATVLRIPFEVILSSTDSCGKLNFCFPYQRCSVLHRWNFACFAYFLNQTTIGSMLIPFITVYLSSLEI